jgi:hypothetical protein
MMRTWTRAPLGVAIRCGQCGALVATGAPLVRITIAAVTRALVRCDACAGPAPPDQPAQAVPVPVARAAAPAPGFVAVSAITPDWRMRAAGREPGEDG